MQLTKHDTDLVIKNILNGVNNGHYILNEDEKNKEYKKVQAEYRKKQIQMQVIVAFWCAMFTAIIMALVWFTEDDKLSDKIAVQVIVFLICQAIDLPLIIVCPDWIDKPYFDFYDYDRAEVHVKYFIDNLQIVSPTESETNRLIFLALLGQSEKAFDIIRNDKKLNEVSALYNKLSEINPQDKRLNQYKIVLSRCLSLDFESIDKIVDKYVNREISEIIQHRKGSIQYLPQDVREEMADKLVENYDANFADKIIEDL